MPPRPLAGGGTTPGLTSYNYMRIFILLFAVLASCGQKPMRQVIIEPVQDSIKNVTVIDLINPDTIVFEAEITKPDSLILEEIKLRADSLARVKFVQDSIQFRKMTKKINGGYNGFDDRFDLWLRARKILDEQIEMLE